MLISGNKLFIYYKDKNRPVSTVTKKLHTNGKICKKFFHNNHKAPICF